MPDTPTATPEEYAASLVPAAVKARIRNVEALYQQQPAPTPIPESTIQIQEQPATSASADAVQAPSPRTQADAEPAPAPAPAPESAPRADDIETWRLRARTAEGRLTKANKDLGELQEQYFQEVVNQRRESPPPPSQQRRAPPPPEPYVTQDDVTNYGTDFLNVTQRAALDAVTPLIQDLRQQNADLLARQARDQRRILDSQVAAAVPDFMEIDRNPAWHRWLLGIDVLSGRVRQQLLNDAISAGNASRVVAFFNGFRAEEAAAGRTSTPASVPGTAPTPPRTAAIDLNSLASPGRARTATSGETGGPPAKPFYTGQSIKQLYEQHRRGAYFGREAEWARQEADIFAAMKEGRVRP